MGRPPAFQIAINLDGAADIGGVDQHEDVDGNAGAGKGGDPLPDPGVGSPAGACLPAAVVDGGGSVQADAAKKPVVRHESGQVVRNQRAVGLDAVGDPGLL